MLAELPPLRYDFDGRDVTDHCADEEGAVVGYDLYECPCCGTRRSPAHPYCCDFASEAQAALVLA